MDLPGELVQRAFTRSGDLYTIKKTFTEKITFVQQDIREQLPDGPFQLILCRNFVLTCFTEALQREILEKIIARLAPGGVLVTGSRESIPQGMTTVVPCGSSRGMYKKSECP
jgi:chemotaxis protein methyltransferase CheR